MKKRFACIFLLLFLTITLSSCNVVGEKSANLSIIYGITALLSLALLIAYCCSVRKKSAWFLLMFSAVLVVNIGYFCLAISTSLSEALLANRISYLGSVLLPFAMLMIILNVTNTNYKKWLPWCLLGLSAAILFIVASPGYLDIYYKEVSFAIVNGVATLVKVYGPLHPLYLIYLLGYFTAMIAVIIRAQAKKTIDTTANAVIIAIAVFVNIGVWFIEQIVSIDFEMLSVSYIISELFLLGVHLIINENQRLKELVMQKEERQPTPIAAPFTDVSPDTSATFIKGFSLLTPKELAVFKAYISGQETKDILTELDIKENTLKYHSKNLYGKLGVSSRKQLVAVYKQLKASGIFTENV